MTYAEVYKNGKIIAEGKTNGSKHYTPEYPEQCVFVTNKEEEVEYKHDDAEGIYFREYNRDYELNYDSREKVDYEEERRLAYLDEIIPCPTCCEDTKRGDLEDVYDNYNIFYKRCCPHCVKENKEHIKRWVFDEGYAGEHLEEDY